MRIDGYSVSPRKDQLVFCTPLNIMEVPMSTKGLLALVLSQFILYSSALYTVGSTLLFFGVWYNGSFWYFYHRLLQQKTQPIDSL